MEFHAINPDVVDYFLTTNIKCCLGSLQFCVDCTFRVLYFTINKFCIQFVCYLCITLTLVNTYNCMYILCTYCIHMFVELHILKVVLQRYLTVIVLVIWVIWYSLYIILISLITKEKSFSSQNLRILGMYILNMLVLKGIQFNTLQSICRAIN